MSDKVLKELLREEKKRRETDKDRRETDKDRRENDKNKDRSRNKSREKSRHKSRERNSHKSRDRSRHKSAHKSKDRRQREHRRSRSEEVVRRKEESIEFVKPDMQEKEMDPREKFMFLYEDSEGKLYKSLSKLLLKNEIEATIFPVYFEGENDNLTQEVVTYRDNKWTASEENKETTWLNVINSQDENMLILDFEEKDVLVYNGKFFHCVDDLIYYLNEYGGEYLDVVE